MNEEAGPGPGERRFRRRPWWWAALAALLLLAATLFVSLRSPPAQLDSAARVPKAGSRAARSVPIIDVHVHLAAGAVSRLEQIMQREGVAHVVNLSGGHPLLDLDDQLRAAASAPGKITVFATLAYEQSRYPQYGRRMAALLRLAHDRGARGLKIAKVLGLGLHDGAGRLIPVDDPGLDVVFETAGALGMPVAIHTGDPEAFWLAVDAQNPRLAELEAHPGWALHDKDVPSFSALLDQLEARVARHPGTTFISVHFGNDAEHPDRVAAMLRKYPNLYIDTAARIPEMGRHAPERMRDFFIEFQDRILYGSDLGVGPEGTPLFLGSQGKDPPTPREYELFFSASRRYFETSDASFEHPTPIQGDWKISGIALPAEVLEKVYHHNAARLLRLAPQPNTLDSQFTTGAPSGSPGK